MNKPVIKGTYVLLIKVPSKERLPVGKRGIYTFKEGWYAYVGSAMGGLEQRLHHHMHEKKRKHWHIDYLLERSTIERIYIKKDEMRNECTIARSVSTLFTVVKGFGASDCSCKGHLFELSSPELLETHLYSQGFTLCPNAIMEQLV
ncbi:MAG: GIY-YIG nuclease family protein [Candidatus Methanofastidiosia archaeon]